MMAYERGYANRNWTALAKSLGVSSVAAFLSSNLELVRSRLCYLMAGLARLNIVIALGVLMSASILQKSQAATDDVAFNECLRALDQSQDALTSDRWHTAPLDANVAQFIEPQLYGGTVTRWISHENLNRSITISILVRDPGPQLGDDPDSFFMVMKQNKNLSLKNIVAVNGFSFARESNEGVNSLLFCTQDTIFKTWIWNGKNWEVSK